MVARKSTAITTVTGGDQRVKRLSDANLRFADHFGVVRLATTSD